MGVFKTWTYLILILLISSCNVTRVVKPLEKGEQRISGNFGGVGVDFRGLPIPVPLTAVNYQKGIDTNVTFTAGIHTTSALFGVFQTDLGLGIGAYKSASEKFGVSISPLLNVLYDIHENNLRLYPQLDATSWWKYSEKPHMFYGSFGTWIELQKAKAHLQVQDNELMPFITVGHQFIGEKWDVQLELKYVGFQHDNRSLVPDYIGPSHYGAAGFFIGVGRRLVK